VVIKRGAWSRWLPRVGLEISEIAGSINIIHKARDRISINRHRPARQAIALTPIQEVARVPEMAVDRPGTGIRVDLGEAFHDLLFLF
jgi:hypothetical protein